MQSAKTFISLLYISVAAVVLTSCIGDKVMMVRYQIQNTSGDTLYLKNTLNKGKEYTRVLPNKTKTVHHDTKVCWMGDCRAHIKTEALLDTLGVYQDSLQVSPVNYGREQWKLKKNGAILRIE